MSKAIPSALERAYRESMECQDACNLSGVAKAFARHLDAIWFEAQLFDEGTDYVNTHPVTLWFLDKLQDLAGRPDDATLTRAYGIIAAINDGTVAVGSPEHRTLMES